MPTYLHLVDYTAEGLAGLMADGGTGRTAALRTLAASLGGELLHVWWSAGEPDCVAIFELPDDVASLALEAKARASGAVADSFRAVRLMSAEEVDRLRAIAPEYHRPGTSPAEGAGAGDRG